MLLTVKRKAFKMSLQSGKKNLNARHVPELLKIRQLILMRGPTIHIEETLFKCSNCNKAFSQACNLKKHERTHIEEKLF